MPFVKPFILVDLNNGTKSTAIATPSINTIIILGHESPSLDNLAIF